MIFLGHRGGGREGPLLVGERRGFTWQNVKVLLVYLKAKKEFHLPGNGISFQIDSGGKGKDTFICEKFASFPSFGSCYSLTPGQHLLLGFVAKGKEVLEV